MVATGREDALEERVKRLERRLAQAQVTVEGHVSGLDGRLRRLERADGRGAPATRATAPTIASVAVAPTPTMGRPRRSETPAQAPEHALASAARASATLRSGMSLGDLVGGRVLAWLGGVTTLLGIVLFLALAISHGWIGEQARVLMAAAASLTLLAGGVWLHDRRGRTEAAVVMVGTATAGLFCTLIVASEVYRLMGGVLAVAGAILVATVASALAIRWAGRAIGGLGLLGALLSGLLAGAPLDPVTVAMLALTGACAMWVVVWQRWGWLALGAIAICAPQWTIWTLEGQAVAVELLVLAWFAALGLLGAVATQLRSSEDRLLPVSAAVAALSACIVAAVGRVVLADAAGAPAGDLWLAALAAAHLGVGMWSARRARVRVAPPLRRLLIAIGVALADVAFAVSGHGLVLTVGWTGAAVAFAWLARRERGGEGERGGEDTALGLGVGAHISLALVRAGLEAPPVVAHAQLQGLLAVATLAAGCIACGQLSTGGRAVRSIVLNALGLMAIAYLTALTLGGAALAATWACEGLVLAQLSYRRDEVVARLGTIAFLGAAALHVLAIDAPPVELTGGAIDLGAAGLALGALAMVGLRAGLMQPVGSAARHWSLIAAAGSVLYLASLATVSAFQASGGAVTGAMLELPVHQQGQVALSALWSVAGLGALVAGLRANIAPARTAGLVLLLVAVAKVGLYDLATLTSIYRVVSFTVLGLLLLAGAFAYQRLRPPPLPDMRTVHPSQR